MISGHLFCVSVSEPESRNKIFTTKTLTFTTRFSKLHSPPVWGDNTRKGEESAMTEWTPPFLRVHERSTLPKTIAAIEVTDPRPDDHVLIAFVSLDTGVTGDVGRDGFDGEKHLSEATIAWSQLAGEPVRLAACHVMPESPTRFICVLERQGPKVQHRRSTTAPGEAVVPAHGVQVVGSQIPEIDHMVVAGRRPIEHYVVVTVYFNVRVLGHHRDSRFDAEDFLQRHYDSGQVDWQVGNAEDAAIMVACHAHPDRPYEVTVVLAPSSDTPFFHGVDWLEKPVLLKGTTAEKLALRKQRTAWRELRTVTLHLVGRDVPQHMSYLARYWQELVPGGEPRAQNDDSDGASDDDPEGDPTPQPRDDDSAPSATTSVTLVFSAPDETDHGPSDHAGGQRSSAPRARLHLVK